MRTHLYKQCNLAKRLLLDKSKQKTIIHHWDTDGIVSASLIYKFLEDQDKKPNFLVPPIGEYSYDFLREHVNNEKNITYVSVDYGVDLKNINIKKEMNIIIIDHHKNNLYNKNLVVCNPSVFGFGENDYPSTSFVIKDCLFEKAQDSLVSIGIIGDLGKRVYSSPFIAYVRKSLERERLDIEDGFKIVELIDSCYKLLDKNCIEKTRSMLAEKSLRELFESSLLQKNLEKIKHYVESIGEEKREEHLCDNIVLVKNTGKYYLTSTIGRRLANIHNNSIIILYDNVLPINKTFIYVRSNTYRVGENIFALREKGYKVGGKDQVFVVECKNMCEKTLSEIMFFLLKKYCHKKQ